MIFAGLAHASSAALTTTYLGIQLLFPSIVFPLRAAGNLFWMGGWKGKNLEAICWVGGTKAEEARSIFQLTQSFEIYDKM